MSGPLGRWERATGEKLDPVKGDVSCWPETLEPTFADVDVAISRTHPKMDAQDPVYEIETLFLQQIAAAMRFLYCESQYFASRRIAEAIARRLDEPDGPGIVIINPLSAQGWLEPIAMDSARARLVAALKDLDTHGRFAIYHPFTTGGEPIYVHAKITIVDDIQLRIGSANMTNRSMRLDTECDVSVDAHRSPEANTESAIVAVRDGLLAEHLGVPVERVTGVIDQSGSLIQAIECLRRLGRSLRPYGGPDLDGVRRGRPTMRSSIRKAPTRCSNPSHVMASVDGCGARSGTTRHIEASRPFPLDQRLGCSSTGERK